VSLFLAYPGGPALFGDGDVRSEKGKKGIKEEEKLRERGRLGSKRDWDRHRLEDQRV